MTLPPNPRSLRLVDSMPPSRTSLIFNQNLIIRHVQSQLTPRREAALIVLDFRQISSQNNGIRVGIVLGLVTRSAPARLRHRHAGFSDDVVYIIRSILQENVQ